MVKTHCNPLYPPGCCSCPPSKKKNPGVPMPASTPISSIRKASSSSRFRPHPSPVTCRGRAGGSVGDALCAGSVAASLLSAGAAGSAMQPLEAKPLDEFPVVGGWAEGGDGGQMSQRLPPAPGRGRMAAQMRRRGSCAGPPHAGTCSTCGGWEGSRSSS